MGKYLNENGLMRLWNKIKHTFANYTSTVQLNILLDKKQNKSDDTLTTTSKTIIGAINELKASSTVLPEFKFDLTKLMSISESNTVTEEILISNGIFTSKDEMIRYITNYFNEDKINIVVTYPIGVGNYYFTEVFQKNKEPLLNENGEVRAGLIAYTISFKYIVPDMTMNFTFRLIYDKIDNIFAGEVSHKPSLSDENIQTKEDNSLTTTNKTVIGAINELNINSNFVIVHTTAEAQGKTDDKIYLIL